MHDEGIVSNIVSTIQLLFTTTACPTSQTSKEKLGIESVKRERNRYTDIYTLHLFCLLLVMPVLMPLVNPVCQSAGT